MANFIEEFYYGNIDSQARSTKNNKKLYINSFGNPQTRKTKPPLPFIGMAVIWRRWRDLNSRVGVTDLPVFEAGPFSRLGTSPYIIFSKGHCKMFFTATNFYPYSLFQKTLC